MTRECIRRRLREVRQCEQGSAVVEFCYVAILLLVPIVYAMLTVLHLQSASYAVTGAAREAGRALAQMPADADPQALAGAAAATAAGDFGIYFDERGEGVAPICGSNPDCRPRPGDDIDIVVHAKASLPFLPDDLDLDLGVTARHTLHVSQYQAGAAR